jgi:tetratricopeptide (TPR) repeat protein
MNRNEEALKAFEKATSLDPKRFDVWGMQADALSKLGKYNEAISIYSKAIEINPNYAGIIYNRGCAYCRKGDKLNALADLKRAISLNPQLKAYAPKDEDFKSLWDDEDFKKLTL